MEGGNILLYLVRVEGAAFTATVHALSFFFHPPRAATTQIARPSIVVSPAIVAFSARMPGNCSDGSAPITTIGRCHGLTSGPRPIACPG